MTLLKQHARRSDVEELGFCQLNIGQLSRNRFWGEDEINPRRAPLCVSSLLWHGGDLLLADPCLPYEQMDDLLFNRAGRRTKDVTALFLTHPHGDHTVDAMRYDVPLYIAPGAEDDWIDSPLWERLRLYPNELLPGVRSILLPGHTTASAGLAFPWPDRQTGRRSALVAGDAVMTKDFFSAETGYFNSADFAAAAETIKMIKRGFDIVIPGHDLLIPV